MPRGGRTSGTWTKDNPGPGRPKGALSGRAKALGVLDKMLAKARNRKALNDSLQRRFEKDPAQFFKEYVAPLLPKDITLEADISARVAGVIVLPSKKDVGEDVE